MSDKVDVATFAMTAPVNEVVTNLGSIPAGNTSRTMAASGFLCGKAVVLAPGNHAVVCLTANDQTAVAGIPYMDNVNNGQVAFCVPVYNGQTIYFRASTSNAQFEGVRLLKSHLELGA